jgi:hypothetical protein
MGKPIYVLDGNTFSTHEEFYREITQALIPGAVEGWIHSLDALNDYLYRGDDKPEGGFILLWKNSTLSRERLGHPETARRLEAMLKRCHPLNVPSIRDRISLAKQNVGATFFDEIVEVITLHEDVELRME